MTDPAPVSIIGATGALGFGLAVRLGRAGVPIVIGSRDATRAAEAAERARAAVPGGSFEGLENAEAAQRAETVILTVPFRSQSETLTNLKNVLREGQLLVDCTVPLAAAVSGRATRMLGVWQGSAAQQAAEMVPDGVRVVAALHTVSASTLSDLDAQLDEDILICGDRKADKRTVAELIGLIDGLRPVDAGRLEMARIVESLTAMLISMNARYKTHAGIRITGLPGELWPS
jgi:8-hydroxy-5-deazaflavin:NADPH oxidoreductase